MSIKRMIKDEKDRQIDRYNMWRREEKDTRCGDALRVLIETTRPNTRITILLLKKDTIMIMLQNDTITLLLAS